MDFIYEIKITSLSNCLQKAQGKLHEIPTANRFVICLLELLPSKLVPLQTPSCWFFLAREEREEDQGSHTWRESIGHQEDPGAGLLLPGNNSLCCKPSTHGESREARDTSQMDTFHRISPLKSGCQCCSWSLPKSQWFHASGEVDTKVQFQKTTTV